MPDGEIIVCCCEERKIMYMGNKVADDDVTCLDCVHCFIDDLFYEECCNLPNHNCNRLPVYDEYGFYDGETTIPCKDFAPIN